MKIKLFFICIVWIFVSCTNTKERGIIAVSTEDFLSSMGVCTSVSRRGENLDETIANMRYTGLRWVRVGYEDDAPIEDFIRLYEETGVRSSYGLLSGGTDVERLVREARQLAQAGALLAIEGANEPNNWGVIYQGEKGGAKLSWVPVANLHRDLYLAVKSDEILKQYPVWATSENGAQTDNVGLQFLTIPKGSNTLMPDGTTYADYANCHNYVSHPSWPGLHDNQTWLSSSPLDDCPVDGLYGNYGRTWLNKFPGYSDEELVTLPRVTTETGYAVNEREGVTEEIQARLYMNLYLSQFKRGWKHTAIYLLKGRANEPEHESYAFFTLENQPKQAAHYMHNFTHILAADNGKLQHLSRLDYTIPNQPETTHDLLLQKSNGNFMLILWGERFGSNTTDDVRIKFGSRHENIKVYDPTIDVYPAHEIHNTDKLDLSLSNHPIIIEIYN